MKKITGLIAVLLFAMQLVQAQATNTYGLVPTQIMSLVNAGVNFEQVSVFSSSSISLTNNVEYLQLNVDDTKLTALFNSNAEFIELSIPSIHGGYWQLLLRTHNMFTPDFSVKIIGDPLKERHQPPPVRCYQGVIKNDMNSIVVITVFENEINGMIADKSGNYILGKNQVNKTSYVLFNDSKIQPPAKFECHTGDEGPVELIANNVSANKGMVLGTCQILDFVCDYDMTLHFGSNYNAVSGYVVSLFNTVRTLYANEGISISVHEIAMFGNNDNFCELNSSCALSDYKFQNLLSGENLNHLLAMDGNNNGGLADLGSLFCEAYAYSEIYASNSIFPAYSWDAYVVTHEIGHNLNSRHTHACVWNGNNTAIDGCGPAAGYPYEGACSGAPIPTFGTVMSYCHLSPNPGISFANGFGVQPGNAMRNFIFNAICFTNCTNDCMPIVTVATPISAGNTAVYNAFNFLHGSSTIAAGSNVSFTAGDVVQLIPGFIALDGSTFNAINATCSTFPNQNLAEAKSLASDFDFNNVEVAPNPFSNNVEITLNISSSQEANVAIFNMLGERLIQRQPQILVKGPNKINLQTDQLKAGIYMLEIKIADTTRVFRIIKS